MEPAGFLDAGADHVESAMRRCGGRDVLLSFVRMFGVGVGELLVVLVVVLLVFGPGRLPEMMGHLGKAMREFQKGLRELPETDVPAKSPTPAPDAKREGEPKLSPETPTETP